MQMLPCNPQGTFEHRNWAVNCVTEFYAVNEREPKKPMNQMCPAVNDNESQSDLDQVLMMEQHIDKDNPMTGASARVIWVKKHKGSPWRKPVCGIFVKIFI